MKSDNFLKWIKFTYLIVIVIVISMFYIFSHAQRPPVIVNPIPVPKEAQKPKEPHEPDSPPIVEPVIYPVIYPHDPDKTFPPRHRGRIIYFIHYPICSTYHISYDSIQNDYSQSERYEDKNRYDSQEIPAAPWDFQEMWNHLHQKNYSAEEFENIWRMTYQDRLVRFTGNLINSKYDRTRNITQLFLRCLKNIGSSYDTILKLEGKMDEELPRMEKDDIVEFYGLLKSFDRLEDMAIIDGLAVWKDND